MIEQINVIPPIAEDHIGMFGELTNADSNAAREIMLLHWYSLGGIDDEIAESLYEQTKKTDEPLVPEGQLSSLLSDVVRD